MQDATAWLIKQAKAERRQMELERQRQLTALKSWAAKYRRHRIAEEIKKEMGKNVRPVDKD